MIKRTKFILAVFLGFQLHSAPLMKAEPTTGLGSEEYGQLHTALVIDSLHTQEPPAKLNLPKRMIATYYSRRFHGRRTASGEPYDRMKYTCAHRTLPFNTILKVTNPVNNNSVIVRVNDRGPFIKNRHIDLSYIAARDLDMLSAGVIPVDVELINADSLNNELVQR